MNKPVWTPIKIKLGDIIGWEHNPRLSNKAQAQRLIESEKRWGQPMAFAVSPLKDGKVFLYDGHQRYSAWLTVYGEDYEVDARQSDIFLTEDERLEFVVTMHAGATGSWDWQKLSSFPAPKLIEMGFDEGLKKQYDFDALNLRSMLTAELDEAAAFGALPDEDRAPFQQMTFTLHDEQAETIREAMKLSKGMGDFTGSPNENSNGNALARICEMFITEHGNS